MLYWIYVLIAVCVALLFDDVRLRQKEQSRDAKGRYKKETISKSESGGGIPPKHG